jgi:hypothetical protein
MKICIKCKEEKELTEFTKCKQNKSGIRTECKMCFNKYIIKWKKENLEKVLKWNNVSPDYHKIYYKNNKEKILLYERNYRSEYQKKRKLVDPLFRLRCNISTSIYLSFKNKGFKKESKTYKYLGCSFLEFKEHLQKQFTEGMNWDNQGKWHLDHIYPVSLAKDEEELIKLNHYTNFQPLWAVDNIKKGNKIIEKQLILI